jgi:hypothetical protein
MTTFSAESAEWENNFEQQKAPVDAQIAIKNMMTLEVKPFSANVIRLKVK